jgi:hypothetical protein
VRCHPERSRCGSLHLRSRRICPENWQTPNERTVSSRESARFLQRTEGSAVAFAPLNGSSHKCRRHFHSLGWRHAPCMTAVAFRSHPHICDSRHILYRATCFILPRSLTCANSCGLFTRSPQETIRILTTKLTVFKFQIFPQFNINTRIINYLQKQNFFSFSSLSGRFRSIPPCHLLPDNP